MHAASGGWQGISRYKHILVCLAVLGLCACSGGGGPAEKPPYPGIKLGKPYEVYGHWYKPHYNPDYDEIGVASWYGPGFHGGRTASGERFDQNAMTAAHKTLPLPSIIRVTNLSNGVSAVIKVNDRGPFAHSRILDLSRGAAAKLGVLKTGTAKVRVQFLARETREYVQNMQNGTQYAMNKLKHVDAQEAGAYEEAASETPQVQERRSPDDYAPGLRGPVPQSEPDEFSVVENTQVATSSPAAQPSPAVPPALAAPFYNPLPYPVNASYFVQAGTFSVRSNALSLIDHISDTDAPQIMEIILNGKRAYRVMVGPYAQHEDAKFMLNKLASIGIKDAKIISN